MSEQMPPEFEWIKPGKFAHQCHAGKEVQILGLPYVSVLEHWIVTVWDGRGTFSVNCDDLVLLDKITLTLTCEQAERFIADVDCLMPMGFYGAHPAIGKLKKQIEEKLK